jgi:branched-subunit amino acid aminotransferase/4-amino-4-deoxychorismate lyase
MLVADGFPVCPDLHQRRLLRAAAVAGLPDMETKGVFSDLKKQIAHAKPKGWYKVKIALNDAKKLAFEINETQKPCLRYESKHCIFLKSQAAPKFFFTSSYWKPANYDRRWKAGAQKERLFLDDRDQVLNTTVAAIVWGKKTNGLKDNLMSSTPRLGVLSSTTLQLLQHDFDFKKNMQLEYKITSIAELQNADFICLVSSVQGFRPACLTEKQIDASSAAATRLQTLWLEAIKAPT